MALSILLLGGTSTLAHKVAKDLKLQAHVFARVAALTPSIDTDTKRELKTSSVLEHIFGSPADLESYQGFDVVVFMVEDDLCAAQKEYIDAAIAGGVKHFYPAEYGPDLANALLQEKLNFAEKISVRKYIEARAQADSSLGYTYLMTGVQANLLLESNFLGLSEDKESATHLGYADAKVSVTHTDDIAQAIVMSLLPKHLSKVNMRRHIRFAGSTLPTSSLYDAISYVLHHPIDVTYQSPDSTCEADKELKSPGDQLSPKRISFRRSLALGGFDLEARDGQELDKGIVTSGREYNEEVKPRNWAQVVHEYFTSGKEQSTTTKKA